MISIVVVYNDKRALNEILLDGLANQTVKFELIELDNTEGKYKSAAEALNYGGDKAKGKYIMFIHQDVELDSQSWLENVEKILDDTPNLGVAGVAGMSERGSNQIKRRKGYVSLSGDIWGKRLSKIEEVQTLDECLLIVPKLVFRKIQFDEQTFKGWHCYGVDYCLSVRQLGLKAYVVPAFIYHRSLMINVEGLLKYQKALYNKHRKNYRHIYSTTGEISWLMLKLYYLFYLLLPFYKKCFPGEVEYLTKELYGCESILDLGCGYNSPIQHCDVAFSVGVELFEPYLQESRKKGIHNEYIKADIRKVEFEPGSFDAVLCREVLEHLTKEEGRELIQKMVRWARKKMIITILNGHLRQDAYNSNPLQEHKSSWSVEELRRLGLKVKGIGGWKGLGGCRATLKCKPTLFWKAISDLTERIIYWYPRLAFQLFATKEIDSEN